MESIVNAHSSGIFFKDGIIGMVMIFIAIFNSIIDSGFLSALILKTGTLLYYNKV